MLHYYRIAATMLPIALEGLPVSSSGHVLLCAVVLQKMCNVVLAGSLPDELDHLVHLPIALMVALFFLPRWYYLLTHITRLWQQFFKMMFLGFVTVLITGVMYLFLKQVGTEWFPLWLGYAITAALLFSLKANIPMKPLISSGFIGLWSRRINPEIHDPSDAMLYDGQWNIYTAPLLGAAQGLALLPGISRLGITYTTARWLGMRPQKAFELSFLIEWPISVAGFLKGLYDLRKSGSMHLITSLDIALMIGASALGFLGLCVMQYLVRTKRVWYLGWYAACLALIALIVCW